MKKVSRRNILQAGAVSAVVGGATALQLTHERATATNEAARTGPGVQQGFFALQGYASFAGENFGHEISFQHNYGQSSPVVTQMPFFNWNVSDYVIARPNPFGTIVTVTARDVGQFYCEFIWTATPQ